MKDLAFDAMQFARKVHRDQRRKYTEDPYEIHLAQVAGIVATVDSREEVLAIAWLHDTVEDQSVFLSELEDRFGATVATGVRYLSDLEEGNRASRKAAARMRLAAAPAWVQSVKVADLISNTSSILQHDPKFAVTYLAEARLLLGVLTMADAGLVAIAREILVPCADSQP